MGAVFSFRTTTEGYVTKMLKSVASFLSAHWMWVSLATFLAFPVWNERKEVVFMGGVQPIKPVSIAANIR